MAQKTQISVLALPGMVHSFSPKSAADAIRAFDGGTVTVLGKFSGTVTNVGKFDGDVTVEQKMDGTFSINS